MKSRIVLTPKKDASVNFHQRRLKHKLKLILFGAVSFLVIFVIYVRSNNESYPQQEENDRNKYVLFWTVFFKDHSWTTGPTEEAGEQILNSVNCPVTNCFFTHNKTLLDSLTMYDAIIFHGAEYRTVPLPHKRSQHQLYIFSSLESPTAVLDDLSRYKNFYNLTLNYRLDSDIEWDYGKVLEIDTNEIIAPSKRPKWKEPKKDFFDQEIWDLIQRKEKPIAWFVSNCYARSRRNDLAKSIQNLTQVDIYGRCGTLQCPVDAKECYDLLNEKYRFYLSFENSLCPDYVTEKLYRPLTQHIIPVVFNGASDMSRYAPPKSYINANEFNTPRDLVNYLNELSENPKEYMQYFWWKKHYKIVSHPTYPYMLCDLCKKLNDPEVTVGSHNYEDIKLWYDRSTCNQNAHIKF